MKHRFLPKPWFGVGLTIWVLLATACDRSTQKYSIVGTWRIEQFSPPGYEQLDETAKKSFQEAYKTMYAKSTMVFGKDGRYVFDVFNAPTKPTHTEGLWQMDKQKHSITLTDTEQGKTSVWEVQKLTAEKLILVSKDESGVRFRIALHRMPHP
ncbi:lipocalin family protein [Eisenibacter elegans]|jgi:hypothetical protein|uniref:lipocalin family protein n=1 Tax=Eisenibacter elegans TaxID=997 RepID=UPI00041A07BE|nr:lipocalin family protein [Eisenibacter elegans]